jgi:uncharacterized protein YacL
MQLVIGMIIAVFIAFVMDHPMNTDSIFYLQSMGIVFGSMFLCAILLGYARIIDNTDQIKKIIQNK